MAKNPSDSPKKNRSYGYEVWRMLRRNKGAMVGMVITIILVVVSLTVDLYLDYDTQIVAQHATERLQWPSAKHIFGTDNLGRDIFFRVVYGSKYSLLIGFSSTLISVVFGVILGSISGYFGGKIDNIIMRTCDVIGAIPGFLLGMMIVSALGPNLVNLAIALGISGITYTTRVTRASVLTVAGSEYVESARAIGMPEWKIILTYILPNGFSPIIVATTLRVGSNIISASSLSFLGLGAQQPMPEWGAMLSAGRNYVLEKPYITLFPGLAIMITVLALNMFGDGLRDAMDPKLRR